jgi:hypothetical protein
MVIVVTGAVTVGKKTLVCDRERCRMRSLPWGYRGAGGRVLIRGETFSFKTMYIK